MEFNSVAILKIKTKLIVGKFLHELILHFKRCRGYHNIINPLIYQNEMIYYDARETSLQLKLHRNAFLLFS